MGKKLLFDALRSENTSARIPWVPFVGVHGAKLISVDAETYLKSPELIVKGIEEAIRLYKPDGIPVVFDLQIEAEALGCELVWAKDNPPAVVSHILDTKKLTELTVIDEKSGRIPVALEATRLLKAKNHDVALYGLVIGPFTLALHLKGTNIFMDMYDTPTDVMELMAFCNKVCKKMAQMYIEAGCDIIALVDPMTSQISPEAFREFVTPYVTELFAFLREKQVPGSFFVCGHAQKNIEAMCETKPDNISVDENIPLDYVKNICASHGVSYGGNLKLTVVLLMGTQDDARKDAVECIEFGVGKGFILAPGCDLPYDTPIENLIAVTEIVNDPYKRQIVKELSKTEEVSDVKKVNLNEYGVSDKVVIDVITLDSEACAPCQYMVEAVKSAAEEFGDLVAWREHKVKQREAVEFMMWLSVKNIPTICIDGIIKFVSVIPSKEELVKAIQKRINEKLHINVSKKSNKLILFGNKEQLNSLESVADQAKMELGSDIDVELIEDQKIIADYGINTLPAVMIEQRRVKSSGRIPSVDVVKEWIKDIQ